MVAASETERKSHDGESRTSKSPRPKRRLRVGRSIREFGECRRHPHVRGTCRQAQGARLLGLRKNPCALPESDSVPAARALRAIQLDGCLNMADRSRTPGHPSGKAGSSGPPQGGRPAYIETELKLTAACRSFD